MIPLRRKRDEPHLLVVGMTGVRMGDRVAQVGCAHGGRLAAVAAKVGISGRAAAFVPDDASAARARKAVDDAGVLVEIEIAPPTALPADAGAFDLAVVDDTGGLLGTMRAEDRVAAVRELLRVLRPGGRTVVIGAARARRPRRAVQPRRRAAVRRRAVARGRRLQAGENPGRDATGWCSSKASSPRRSPMPRFAANLTMLFNEVPFLDRFAAARRAGFAGVEYLFPYEHEPNDIRRQLDEHGLTQVLHNLPAGNWSAGERGIASHPDRVAEFEDGVTRAIQYATALGCTQLNCLAGIAPAGVDQDRARATFVANLRGAARRLQDAGIRLLIEPINTRDIPGFFLRTTAQALEIIGEVGSANLFLQYDVYHMQIMEGDLATTIEKNLDRIAHVQIADNPGRHEPGTGEINYEFLFEFLDRIGYAGWIGCEYKPAAGTEAGLGWMTRRAAFARG